MPSRYETMSNAVLEAMACGVPFVASGCWRKQEPCGDQRRVALRAGVHSGTRQRSDACPRQRLAIEVVRRARQPTCPEALQLDIERRAPGRNHHNTAGCEAVTSQTAAASDRIYAFRASQLLPPPYLEYCLLRPDLLRDDGHGSGDLIRPAWCVNAVAAGGDLCGSHGRASAHALEVDCASARLRRVLCGHPGRRTWRIADGQRVRAGIRPLDAGARHRAMAWTPPGISPSIRGCRTVHRADDASLPEGVCQRFDESRP